MKPEDFSTNGERLLYIQTNLKTPKSQYNKFGEYNYRSAEDINEAVKPLLAEVGATLVPTHRTYVEDGWHYVETTVVLRNVADDSIIAGSTAPAREQETRPKMDASQLTGGALSYSKKYAYNNIFLLDDTRDADSMSPEVPKPVEKSPPKAPETPPEPTKIFTWDALVKMHDLPPTATEEFVKHIVKTTQEGSKAGIDGVKNKARKNPKSFVEKCRKWIEEETSKEASDQEVGDNTPPKLDEVNANE